jgi:predicted AlkP superfamily phosphohydrolase/phosphomutase
VSFLRRFQNRKHEQRVVFIGLDGTPFTFLQRLIAEGRAPNAERLVRQGSLLRMDSTWPWVSSVAWSSMMTGVNPGKHNIFGFIDRDPATYKQFIPTSQNMRARTLWEVLSDAGKRVIVINVPVTYPPRPVNGILVGCFLSPNLEKAVYPASYLPTLQSLGYILDADPWKARESKDLALQEVNSVLDARIRTLYHLLDREQWDYLHVHIMRPTACITSCGSRWRRAIRPMRRPFTTFTGASTTCWARWQAAWTRVRRWCGWPTTAFAPSKKRSMSTAG